MELDSIKSYVNKYSDAYLPLSSIKGLTGVYIFIGFVPLIAGIVAHRYIVMSIFIVAEIFYITLVNILERKMTSVSYYQRFLLSASSSLFMSLFFLMIPYSLIETADSFSNRTERVVYSLIIGLAWIFAVFLIFSFKIYNLKTGKYRQINKEQKNMKKIVITSSIGAIFGVSLMKFASKWMTQEMAINVVFILCYIVSVLAALGIPHFLIAYFVKKYSIPGEPLPVFRNKMSSKKRMVVKILTIFLAVLAIMTVLGVLVVSNEDIQRTDNVSYVCRQNIN